MLKIDDNIDFDKVDQPKDEKILLFQFIYNVLLLLGLINLIVHVINISCEFQLAQLVMSLMVK